MYHKVVTEGGFARGCARLEELEAESHKTGENGAKRRETARTVFEIEFQNENLLVWQVKQDRRAVVATVPDIITLVDSDSGRYT